MKPKFLLFLAFLLPLAIFAQPCTVNDATGCVCEDGSTDCYLLPNIKLSYDLLVDPSANPESPGELRVSVSTPNVGHGPLRVIATNNLVCGVDTFFNSNITVCPDGSEPSQLVQQRIYKKEGNTMTYEDRWAGTMTYHPTHNHSHFDDWGVYSIRIPDPNEPNPLNWPMVGEGAKLGFCLMDYGSCEYYNGQCRDDNDNILTTDSPNYGLGGGQYSCGVTNQGISCGWTDIYYYYLDGMYITIPDGVCNGDYMIVVQVDPNDVLLEENEDDNIMVAPITLTQQTPPGSVPFEPVINTFGTTDICNGESVELTVSTPGTEYLWSNGATTRTITVSTAGTYTCTVTSPCGTATTPAVTVNVESCSCLHNYSFSALPVCSDEPILFEIEPGCVTDSTVVNQGIDLDLYMYAPGGVPGQAPAGYNPLAGTNGIDPAFPITNSDLTSLGGIGPYWNQAVCSDFETAGLTNNACLPETITYFWLPWDYTLDSDGNGQAGEYNNISPSACAELRYDVEIYPAPMFTIITDDGITCGIPTVELVAADGSVCETQIGPECSSDGDSFTTDFAMTPTGLALANAPGSCSIAENITIGCSSCVNCPISLSLIDTIPSGTHNADMWLDANGQVVNGSNVIIHSGGTILLYNGFEIESNADCSVEIEDCNQ